MNTVIVPIDKPQGFDQSAHVMPFLHMKSFGFSSELMYESMAYHLFIKLRAAEEELLLKNVNHRVEETTLNIILESIKKSVENMDKEMIDTLSQAYQRIKSVQTLDD